ncbi:MAG: hypothetical protein P4L50_30415 [Anaerolineaceae bacterium]|nr:hypothetical protein [Anaerolineaceae bacterium]
MHGREARSRGNIANERIRSVRSTVWSFDASLCRSTPECAEIPMLARVFSGPASLIPGETP